MSSNHTQNFSLSQWLPTDAFKLEDFNSDNSIIDGALGLCLRCMYGTYTGTGQYGSSNKNTLTFEHPPKIVMIENSETNATGMSIFIWGVASPLMVTAHGSSQFTFPLFASYSDNTVSWYSNSGDYLQLNFSGYTYRYYGLY